MVLIASVLIAIVTVLAVLAVGPHDWFAFLFLALFFIASGARLWDYYSRRES